MSISGDDMTRAIGLYRVSTKQQASTGSGLNAQEDAVREYAERNGLQLVAEFTDAGVSGAAPLEKREGLLQALAQLGKGDVLLVAKYDRIARDLLLQLTIEKLVARKGARIVSVTEGGSSSQAPSDILLRNLLGAVAQYERALIGSRISAAHKARRARGYVATTPPYGFSCTLENKLVPNKGEKIVCDAVRWMRTMGFTWLACAEKLNERGYRNRAGRVWSLHNLRAIFVKRDGYEKVKSSPRRVASRSHFIFLPLKNNSARVCA